MNIPVEPRQQRFAIINCMSQLLSVVRLLGGGGAVVNARAELELRAGREAQVDTVIRRVHRSLATAAAEVPSAAARRAA